MKKIGFNHIRINRSYTNLGGKNNRYLEKSLYLTKNLVEDTIFDMRPESLTWQDFVKLTKMIENVKLSN